LLGDLLAALAEAGSDQGVRAVVLTGAGKFFCGGFDLGQLERRVEAEARDNLLYRSLFRDAFTALLGFAKPTIAMLNGHAIAGGLVMLLACDYRLGLDADYKIGLNEVAIGAAFPRAAHEIVALRLTHAQASELMLGAALYPAAQALRLGVVDELLPAATFSDTVLRRAARLGAFPRQAYAHTKARLLESALARISAEPAAEVAQTAAVWASDESVGARHKQREKLGLA
jgi:enoyl-CoA hydratase